jgi:hypothetical protein
MHGRTYLKKSSIYLDGLESHKNWEQLHFRPISEPLISEYKSVLTVINFKISLQ